jgi:hypothetical protein
MKKKLISVKYILLSILALMIIVQFLPSKVKNPKVITENDLISITKPEKEIETILRNSCYDCHSNETKFPWYSKVAPASWFLNSHIEKGRSHFNFSNWKTYSAENQISISQNCIEEIKDGEMPLWSYTLLHSEAKLNSEEKEKLISWFTSEFKIKFDTEQ